MTVCVLLPATLTILALPAPVRAHGLRAEYQVLTGKRIQVEGWFDSTDSSPRGAKVRVSRADGSVLTEGELNDKGMFVFSYEDAAPLRIRISAGAGHIKELVVPTEALEQGDSLAATARPFADRSPRVVFTEILAGVACVFAVAAFVISLRTTRRLRELHKE